MTPINRDPDKLCPCIRRKYDTLLAQCYSKDIQLVTIETIRAIDRQRYYVDRGVSWTLNSLHLPQEPHMLALAFDICPHEYLSHPEWNPAGEKWMAAGRLGTDIGLGWGYDLWGRDMPHFQLKECECES
jgi:hypothetical protein